ncbi:hypothetical protein RLOC_00001744 [Lonchura striata]|uniref:Uncharacterized protein n=1 Tax=Lonchura striata TaxID=40157 RepID=A0A218V552_9PASE|nr:hypothetical protein RLOC_00001744 [Lonchura striata domestica]
MSSTSAISLHPRTITDHCRRITCTVAHFDVQENSILLL